MGINKLVYGGQTKFDITDTTATASDVLSGKDFYLANGEKATGSIENITMTHATLATTTNPTYALSSVTDAIKIPVGYNTNARHAGLSSDDKKLLIADNIKSGVTILGVQGSYTGGGGDLPSGISKLDFGQITVSSAFTTTRQTYNHKLGVTPDLMMVWSPTNIATTYSMMCAIRGSQFGWRSSAYNNHMAYHGNSTTSITWTNSNSTTYGISNMTASNFQLASSSSSYYWRAGTYNYIAIKFS